jgi:hypothetical protein
MQEVIKARELIEHLSKQIKLFDENASITIAVSNLSKIRAVIEVLVNSIEQREQMIRDLSKALHMKKE